MKTDLVSRPRIVDLVAVYQQEVVRVREAFRIIHTAQNRLTATFGSETRTLYVGASHWRYTSWNDPGDVLKEIRQQVWSRLVEMTEVRRFASDSAMKAIERQIKDDQMPEITVENVLQLMSQFDSRAAEFATDAVKEVFDFLRARRETYKTNNRFVVGPKVVLQGIVEPQWRGGYQVRYFHQQSLVCLENVFRLLDGKVARSPGYKSEIERMIWEQHVEGETEFVKFRCFKNGNLHLAFKRLDLVELMNAVAGGKAFMPRGNDATTSEPGASERAGDSASDERDRDRSRQSTAKLVEPDDDDVAAVVQGGSESSRRDVPQGSLGCG